MWLERRDSTCFHLQQTRLIALTIFVCQRSPIKGEELQQVKTVTWVLWLKARGKIQSVRIADLAGNFPEVPKWVEYLSFPVKLGRSTLSKDAPWWFRLTGVHALEFAQFSLSKDLVIQGFNTYPDRRRTSEKKIVFNETCWILYVLHCKAVMTKADMWNRPLQERWKMLEWQWANKSQWSFMCMSWPAPWPFAQRSNKRTNHNDIRGANLGLIMCISHVIA